MVEPIAHNDSSNRVDLTGDPVRRRRERVVRLIFFGSAGFSILVSLAIVVSLVGEALELPVDRAQIFHQLVEPSARLLELRAKR